MYTMSLLWLALLIGSFSYINNAESRAVNITNTWTLPQEGFAVFYRYFRDKISWFEADAVCQFHHANLVTVSNGEEFDATRAFLKELDVTDTVWIGLMRPQNTDRFTWANSKPLVSSHGEFWAESLPVLDAPLCAVIDPVRDFRWHALRCGGPATAAFLCEMNVPEWAKECAIRAMPSLTVQYQSDSGSVELFRDCGELGTRHVTCQGKQDRDVILRELMCKDDDTSSAENNLSASSDEKAPININGNKLELLQKSDVASDVKVLEETQVENQMNRLDNDDVMMGDQPAEEQGQEKPLKQDNNKEKSQKQPKKSARLDEKKMKELKKDSQIKKKELLDDVMMGDQPSVSQIVPESSDANKIAPEIEPLPHIKKYLPQDLKKMETTATAATTPTTIEIESTSTTTEATPLKQTTEVPTTVQQSSTADARTRRESEVTSAQTTEHSTHVYTSTIVPSTTILVASTTTSDPVSTVSDETSTDATENEVVDEENDSSTVTSPKPESTTAEVLVTTTRRYADESMPGVHHPHYPFGQKSEIQNPHEKAKKANKLNDHFVPPMLLVKAKFTSTKPHSEMMTSTTADPMTDEVSASSSEVVAVAVTEATPDLTTDVTSKESASLITSHPEPMSTTADPTLLPHHIAEVKLTEPPLTTPRPVQEIASEITENKKNDAHLIHATELSPTNEHAADAVRNETPTDAPIIVPMISTNPPEFNDLSNANNYTPYRPNRRRSLTKMETQSYLKKILG